MRFLRKIFDAELQFSHNTPVPVFNWCSRFFALNLKKFEADYRNPTSFQSVVVDFLHSLFFLVFLVECVLKVVAFGFVFGQYAYLRDPWCILDFIVVISGVISLIPCYFLRKQQQSVDILRTIRVLRAFKSFSSLPALKQIVNTFLLSLPRLINVAAMFLLLMILYSILGLNFLGGTLYQ